MKMDYDLLVHAPSGLNPLGQRELSLRGLRIQLLENLVLTKVHIYTISHTHPKTHPNGTQKQNQNDVLDLTDNDLRRLQNFPLLPRLSTLLLSNNRLGHIEPDIGSKLTGLQTLVLNNNELSELGDLEPLKGLRNLKTLSLYDNPVTLKPHYRDFVIVSLPQVQCLDFNRVTPRVGLITFL
jgi:U2 small nuclear ribonucleoprotein A'